MSAPAFDPSYAPEGDIAVRSSGCFDELGRECKYHNLRRSCITAPCCSVMRPDETSVIFLDAPPARVMATVSHPCGSLGEEVAP